MSHNPSTTGILLIDPYNDFLSEGGKLWPRVKAVAEEVGLLQHLRAVVSAVRDQGLKIFFVPHNRWKAGDYVCFDYPRRISSPAVKRRSSPKEVASGFANTDLDLQLKQHGIRRIVLIGMIANTCIESTGRFRVELGYHFTLIKAATAAFSQEGMYAAHVINGPTYAHAILTTQELLTQLLI